MYVIYLCIYIYIHIYTYVHLHGFVKKHVRRPPVALLAPLPRDPQTAAPDPRAPRGPRGPALQHQDLQPHLLTIDLNQKDPWNFCVAFACFFRCESNQTGKKTKKKQFQELCEDFKKKKLAKIYHPCYHLLFIDFLSPKNSSENATATWLRRCCRALSGERHLVHQRSKVGGASSLWEVESCHDIPTTTWGDVFWGGIKKRTSKII